MVRRLLPDEAEVVAIGIRDAPLRDERVRVGMEPRADREAITSF